MPFFSSLLFSPPSHAATNTDSLVGYWKFDETSGTSAADASGDGNTGTHTNGPTISTDVPSMISFTNARSLSFDGTNDYVSVSDSNSLDLTNNFTITTWIKVDGASHANGTLILCKHDSTNDTGYNFFYYQNKLSLQFGDGGGGWPYSGTAQSSTTLTVGQWYHAAVVRDGTT